MQTDHVILLDCRYQMDDQDAGFEQYKEGHLKEARFFDLSHTFIGELATHGGRHPLPTPERLTRELGVLGIQSSNTIVVYDGGTQEAAARAWFILHYAGCSNVFVLDGGFKRWIAQGNEVTREVPRWEPVSFDGTIQQRLIVSMEEVRQIVQDKNAAHLLIDSRAPERYRGEVEPIDSIAGHIPTAVNAPWQESLNENGEYLSASQQKERFKNIPENSDVVVYCGSGITASVNMIALLEAGYKNVQMYAGSYSDWISYPDNQIEK